LSLILKSKVAKDVVFPKIFYFYRMERSGQQWSSFVKKTKDHYYKKNREI
jgi:hypothetical protein